MRRQGLMRRQGAGQRIVRECIVTICRWGGRGHRQCVVLMRRWRCRQML